MKMLLSLTLFPFDNFDSNTKGGCDFLTSWNQKFLLKTLQKEPKWFTEWSKNSKIPISILDFARKFIEPYAEKHFFFDENKKKQLIYHPYSYLDIIWGENKFKGAFVDYFNKINKHKMEKEIEEVNRGNLKTLLPEYSFSFIIQEITDDKTLKEPFIFTIQNGLFSKGTPKLDLKFDLKGSYHGVDIKESIENILKNGINGKVLRERNFKEIFKNGIKFDKKEEYEEFIGMVKTDSEVIKNCKK
uniref:SERPIN domain-containing protein n=1 Tax=Meloidogyne hapla TaxID=6305 RepID=A0A1I8B0H4_MELHA